MMDEQPIPVQTEATAPDADVTGTPAPAPQGEEPRFTQQEVNRIVEQRLRRERDRRNDPARRSSRCRCEVEELLQAHPEVDLDALAADKSFTAFVSGRQGSLTERFDDYRTLLSHLQGDAAAEARYRFAERALKSTANGSSSSLSRDYGLTPRQKALARENGMTYREYAQLFKEV